jgi:RNA polymerase sigma-70 factor (ECF subfamily)
MSGPRDEAGEAESLLARIAGGDERALGEFYDSFHGRIHAFVRKYLRNPADAAEVLNEVMLEVWRRAGRFEGRSRALTWVLGIAHHKAIDCQRRQAPPAEDDSAIEDITDDSVSAIDALAGAEDAARLRRCLDQLPAMHRAVLHLAFFEDRPYPEIAEVVGCPLGTVKTRVFHAKQQLKLCLTADRGGIQADDPVPD